MTSTGNVLREKYRKKFLPNSRTPSSGSVPEEFDNYRKLVLKADMQHTHAMPSHERKAHDQAQEGDRVRFGIRRSQNPNALLIEHRGTYLGPGRGAMTEHGWEPVFGDDELIVEGEDAHPYAPEAVQLTPEQRAEHQRRQAERVEEKSIPVYLTFSPCGKHFDLVAVVPSEGGTKTLRHGPYKSYEGAVALHHAWGLSLMKHFPGHGIAVLTDVIGPGERSQKMLLVHHEKGLKSSLSQAPPQEEKCLDLRAKYRSRQCQA